MGSRHVLEDVLIPELESDWAQAMGTQMTLMLEHLEGRDEQEPRFIAGENARFEAVLAKANAVPGAAAVPVPEAPEEEGLPALRARNAALCEAVSEAIEAAYAADNYTATELPSERLGISDDLFAIVTEHAAFW